MSIYTAEVTAVGLALLTVKENNLKNVIILADSSTLQILRAQTSIP
jgi:hypothetical protein